jgi:hypothetical protein
VGTQHTVSDNGKSPGHHNSRDPTLSAGAVGAAGIAEHEHHNSHSGPTPLAEKPKGKDLGDILHGVERNRGVPGSSGFPGTEGFASGTGGALSAKEVPQPGISGESTSQPAAATLSLDPNPGLGVRSAGQYQKTDSGYAAGGNNNQTAEHEHTISGDSHQKDHSSAVPRGSGLDIANEYRKQKTESEFTSSNAQPGFTGSSASSTGVNDYSDGRNRLHKDPPAGHPASQTGSNHVPASKDEREKVLNEGEKMIDKDTGVAHAHATGGGNAAINY